MLGLFRLEPPFSETLISYIHSSFLLVLVVCVVSILFSHLFFLHFKPSRIHNRTP